MAKPSKRNCYICATAGELRGSIPLCDDCMKRHRLRTELRSDAAPLPFNPLEWLDLQPL